MAKRIYQVAKSLGVKGVELVHYLRDQGFDVASHMSQVSAEMQESIDKRFAPAGDSSEKPAAKKAVKKVAKKATKKATVKKATKKAVLAHDADVDEVVDAVVDDGTHPKHQSLRNQHSPSLPQKTTTIWTPSCSKKTTRM